MRNLVTLRHSSPFSMLNDVERDFRKIFNTLDYSDNRDVRSFTPSCDISEKDDKYLFSFDVPGVPKEDINIEVHNNQIKISGERKSQSSEGDYVERKYGHFERVLSLPEHVNEDAIQAHFENGVLSVLVPKVEKSQPIRIEIATNSSDDFWNRQLKDSSSADKLKMSKEHKGSPAA